MEAKRRALAALVLALASGAFYVYFRGWECRTTWCGGRGGVLWAAIAGVIIAAEWMWRAKGKIVIDDKGLIINRHLIAWTAVRTMAWVWNRDGGPGIQLGIHQTDGDRDPRRVVLTIARKDLMDRRMSLTEFWRTVQERASPRNVMVQSDPPETDA